MRNRNLKIGIIAKNQDELESFVSQICYPKFDLHDYIVITELSSTNSLNLDLTFLTNQLMLDIFRQSIHLVR